MNRKRKKQEEEWWICPACGKKVKNRWFDRWEHIIKEH